MATRWIGDVGDEAQLSVRLDCTWRVLGARGKEAALETRDARDLQRRMPQASREPRIRPPEEG